MVLYHKKVRLCLPALAVGVLVLGLLAACKDKGLDSGTAGRETPAATAGETETAAPTPVPADLGLAQRYQRNGQYEDAVAVYEAVVARGSAQQKHEARLALARLYLSDERYEEARDQISAYLAGAEGERERRLAHFLLGRALTGLGEDAAALELFAGYGDGGGIAVPYAQAEMARILVGEGRLSEAAQQAEAALAGGLPDSLRPGLLLSMAQGAEAAGAPAEASRWYGRLYEESPSTADKALALWRQGAMKRLLGDASWPVDLQTVISTYPITSAATEALDELLAAGEAVDPYREGLVYYRHLQNQEALAALNRSLEEAPAGPNAAAAHYYRAATYERLGDEETALADYAAAYDLSPGGDLADDALWWRARLLEGEKRYGEAAGLYQRLAEEYASSDWAEEGAFRQGLMLYKQDRFFEAASVWHSAASTARDPEERARAALWTAKAELAGGDEGIGLSHLRELARERPFDFYGLRAGVLLAEMEAAEATPTARAATAEPGGDVQSWLASVSGGQPVDAWTLWLSRRWARGQELIDLGFPREAAAEFRALIEDYGGEPLALLALSESFRLLGETEMSSRSATRILDQLVAGAAAAAPPGLLSLAYPEDYMSLLESVEAEEGVSPLAMLALIRQESFFDPLAGSGAGALGLTQVIPPTGREIAGELGRSDFDEQELFRPEVSILFGAHYLGNQLAAFEGNLYYALAAYNGGPGNAQRWEAAAGGDVDLFLEESDFSEPKLYVRRVMENLAVYRYLYGGAAGPSLAGE